LAADDWRAADEGKAHIDKGRSHGEAFSRLIELQLVAARIDELGQPLRGDE
jgi:hypothetical protein